MAKKTRATKPKKSPFLNILLIRHIKRASKTKTNPKIKPKTKPQMKSKNFPSTALSLEWGRYLIGLLLAPREDKIEEDLLAFL